MVEMEKYKLGDICEIVSGSTPKTNIDEYWEGTIKWITPAELNDDTYIITDSVRKITELAVKKTGLKSFPEGTVILSSRAPIGKVAIAGCEMYCNQGFKNLICSKKINNKYLYWFLKGNTVFLNSLGRGATFKELSKSIVSNIEINLPDIVYQKKAVETFGKLDIAVNDAGIMDDNTAIADMSDTMLMETFRINTFGLMYGMREECRQYLAQGNGGVIVNICSVGATHQTSGAAYCASKGAVLAATKNTAFMYMEEGIRCNALSPGGVVTDIPLVMPPSDEFGFGRTSMLLNFSGELAMPEDLADAILFLASDQSRYVNGEELKCDGGWTCF